MGLLNYTPVSLCYNNNNAILILNALDLVQREGSTMSINHTRQIHPGQENLSHIMLYVLSISLAELNACQK